MEKEKKLVRFDWAIKRLLRHKADHTILEGFLTSLLGRPIKILELLESESNKDYDENKYNRVDMLAQEADGAKILIEVQNETEDSYFHRMLFGTSRVISEYLKSGENYDSITKIYSVNIVYFKLGEGTDYVYKGETEFRGIHNDELLELPPDLQAKYKVEKISEIFPEYFILRANDFNRWSKTPLDQWLYFLSNSHIPEDADAPGLKEAGQELLISTLTPEDREAYYKHLRDMNYQEHRITDAFDRGQFYGHQEGLKEGLKEGRKEGLKKGREEGEKSAQSTLVRNMLKNGMSPEQISSLCGLELSLIEKIKKDYDN